MTGIPVQGALPRAVATVGVVGAGRVGAVLAAKFRAAGHPVVGVSGRSAASQLRIQTLLEGVESLEPAEVVERADVVLIAVPDDALADVAAELAAHVRAGQVVMHTSGRHGLAVLAPMTDAGARAIAFHPAMTFTGTEVDLERACAYGLTARPADRPLAEALVIELGGTPEWIDETDRTSYHAALSHGANHLNTLVAQAMDVLRGAGVADPSAVLRPLLTAALDNTLAYGDAALTGPVARGDVSTVQAHTETLAGQPEILDAYVALARATAARAAESGRIDAATAAALRQVLSEAEWESLAAATVIA
ncbi:MAG TPA: Rossmann-like and DUF2520 domain-containing protein [Aeromicrobium sp.]|nr:Rossmann-like and DUF2520 domain-containing protein [Aeromicrobium sp.]HKY58688.1 Rossmann-like and DUF2520 domain-containing protein [Aeromicrobium sp.]